MAYDWPGNIREIENVSVYFHAFNCLPEYLTQNAFVRSDLKNTDARSSSQLELTLLKLISVNTSTSHGIGRSAILRLLHDNKIKISDNKLRKLLSGLESRGFLQINKGRGGTMITDRGLETLKAESQKFYK